MSDYLKEFICSKCNVHVTWAMKNAMVICPKCGKKITLKNMKNPNPASLPLEGDQLVLFED